MNTAKDTEDEKLSIPFLTVAACIALVVGSLDPQWGDIHPGGLGAVALTQDMSDTVQKIVCVGAGDRVEYTNITDVSNGAYVKIRKSGEDYQLAIIRDGHGDKGETFEIIPGSFFPGNSSLCPKSEK